MNTTISWRRAPNTIELGEISWNSLWSLPVAAAMRAVSSGSRSGCHHTQTMTTIQRTEVHVPTAMTVRPRSDRDDRAPGIGQEPARQQHEEIDEVAEMVLHRHRPVRRAEGIRYNGDERQQREVAEQQRKLWPRHADTPNPDLTPANQREQAKQHHIIKLLPRRIDNRQQAGDHGERDIARPYRQLQALLLCRGERGLRELNGVRFGVAPTARAWRCGGQVEALDKRGHTAASSSRRLQHRDGRQQPQPQSV